ncbi:GUB WAK bind domain-containing protein [Salix suchowensis]|nr:GUB WAK bind domain-containing protein [Salix suchowensis]
MSALFFITLSIFSSLVPLAFANNAHASNPCRSYCGNITIDYPFALQYGCGHPGFRDLLFCMNDVLMFHISSGSYRVLEIDYAYQSVTLHEPHLSTCDTLVLGGKGNGFAVEQWRSPYFNPTADNVFMLIGCSAQSSLFQGFPGKHLPCRNVSGMGCEEYYGCQAWSLAGRGQMGSMFGSGPPECCAVAFEAIKAINLSKLGCEGYSSAYMKYSVQGNEEFCRACEATGGTCGYGSDGIRQLCMCGNMNSTSNCDSATSATSRRRGQGLHFIYFLVLL